MNSLPQPDALKGFWSAVGSAAAPVLALDYDGTLAPFHVDPLQAVPFPGIPGLLRATIKRAATRVIIVSGRPLSEVRHLLPLPAWYIGSHGRETASPVGEIRKTPPKDAQLVGLQQAGILLDDHAVPGRREWKPASLALHTRGMAEPDAATAIRRANTLWAPLCPKFGLEILPFNGGLEIRATGRHKGTATLDLLAELLPRPDLTIFLGDDHTDEDLFTALHPPHTGILVGPARETAARAGLPSIRDVRSFLGCWIRKRLNT